MPEESDKKLSQKDEEKVIEQFMSDFDLAFTAESHNRLEQVEDLRFAALDQWPDDVKKDRKNRPMLTMDRIGQSVRKVLGDMRQNMPSIKVHPIDDNSDPETADVLEGLVRNIESASDAKSTYINAALSQVKCGYGVWRVNTKENEHDVFEQDVVIVPVKNPFTVYFDPDAIKPQKQDGRFAIVSNTMSKEAFEREFPDVEMPVSISNKGTGEQRERWYAADSIRIGEYYVKRKTKKKLTQLSNGQVVESGSITDEDITLYQQQGITPVREREVDSFDIEWYKLTAFKVLDHKKWAGKFIPLVPVYGEEDNIEGETRYRGIVRPAKDAQRMYNYWSSAAAETIALQPKAPWLVTKDQVKNYKHFWNRANTDNLPYMPYEPDGKAPPPQRIAPPALQAGLLQQASIAAGDIQQATGVFDPSTGQLSDQRSGRAVVALQREADVGTSVYMHNLAKAIEHTGAIIVDLVPKYYDTQRTVRIRGEDDIEKFVTINQPILTPDGSKIQNDITRGKYDVRVATGPNFRTRRVEAANSMVELARVFPQVLQVAGDLVAKNLDWPGADEMAERLRKLLPPGIVDDDQEVDPQQMQQQQALLQAQQQQAQLNMSEQQANIENKQADTAAKLANIPNTQADTHKKLTESEQNQIENAVKVAELAAEQENRALLNQALSDIIGLINQPSADINAGVVVQ